jgi:transcriptional regulator with XRE-family HTH domain
MLRELRKAANISQEKFADAIGMSFAGYRPYERGERDLTADQIERFAQALGVPVSEITRRLWPDESRLEELHFSHEWAEIQQQVANLPEPLREQILRIARQSIEVANGAADLARRN